MNRGRGNVALLLLVLTGLLTWIACGNDGGREAATPADPSAADVGTSLSPETRQEEAAVPLRRLKVEIYFPSTRAEGLIGEYREIFDTALPGDQAKQIVADLISGPTSPDSLPAVPPGVRLRQVFVLPGGVAYLDFNSELADGMRGGSMAELLTVYSIVDSVALNVAQISRVALLIDGNPVSTFGHLDLRRPLPPNTHLILQPVEGAVDAGGGVIRTASSLPYSGDRP